MPLWTDLIDPVEATGIARAEQQLIERAKGGTLARYLPNVFVPSHFVEFYAGDNGLTDVAHYRTFNSPPKIGGAPKLSRKTITLPAVSRNEPINEQEQMTWGRLSPEQQTKSLERAIRRTVQSISDRQELTRGILIETGSVIVDDGDFLINDVMGRDAALNITAATLWSDPTVDRMAAIETWAQVYASYNAGRRPQSMRMSRQAFNALAAGDQFKIALAGGGSASLPADQVTERIVAQGLPEIDIYDRQVKVNGVMVNVLDPAKIELLPEPTDPFNEDGSDLGATFWGTTRSAQFDGWGIQPDEQPGIVCGVFGDETVGANVEVQGDSIGEPVARNANASMTIKVL